MQTPSRSDATSIPESSSFAGFLTALASPAPASQNASWKEDALADDVATLSYESALKALSRYKPALDPLPPLSDALRQIEAKVELAANAGPQTQFQNPATGEPKSASITIRISEAECAQLKQRAAEAGMTLSAYLRSCTFEAEALRGQVKQALAQLRASASASDKQAASIHDRSTKFGWLPRIFSNGAPTRREQGHSCP